MYTYWDIHRSVSLFDISKALKWKKNCDASYREISRMKTYRLSETVTSKNYNEGKNMR